jgi:CBS domain containing-hemolysin-like protein/mannitol/fructose-specific phosphotransferase system IIA component (Ntr-type)
MLIILLIATLLLLLLNAFFVLAEFAAVKVRPTRVEELVDDGNARAKVLQHIQYHLDEYLSVCQVGITFASIGLGFVSKPAFEKIVSWPLTWLGVGSPAMVSATSVTIAYMLVSFLHILLGELVPKSIAIRRAEASGLWIAVPLRFCHFLFFIPLWILNTSANAILHLMGMSAPMRESTHTEDEIRIILERAQSSGAFSFLRLLVMENVFDLGSLKVKDAMRPPKAVKSLQATAPWPENLKIICESKFSRFPLLDGDQPLPVGVVHVKDVLHQELNKQEAPDLKSILRPYLKVTEDQPLESLLSQLQHLRRRVAIVVDRKGQWVGFLTLEDVIEEIIGSVEDEFEKETPLFLADAMTAGRIVVGVSAPSIVEAIPLILSQVPQSELPLPPEKIAKAVLDREAELSTYLGHGLAVPHARLENITQPVVVFAQSREGIPVKDSTERIHLIFMLLSPQSLPMLQVRLLARISGVMQSEYVVECLRDNPNPAALLEIIRAADPAILS